KPPPQRDPGRQPPPEQTMATPKLPTATGDRATALDEGVALAVHRHIHAPPSLTISTRRVDQNGLVEGESFTPRELRAWCRDGLRCTAGTGDHLVVLRSDLEAFLRERGASQPAVIRRPPKTAQSPPQDELEQMGLRRAGGAR